MVALPALRALSALGPTRLFLADGRFSSFLEQHGIPLSGVYPFRALRTWIALLFGRYDYCVNCDSMYLSYTTRSVMILAHAKLNVGYHSGPLQGLIEIRPPESPDDVFMGEVFNNLARCLGGTPEPICGVLRRNEDGPIVLHVGGRFKRWPVQKYVELAERCAEVDIPVKILWGPGDPKPDAKPSIERGILFQH